MNIFSIISLLLSILTAISALPKTPTTEDIKTTVSVVIETEAPSPSFSYSIYEEINEYRTSLGLYPLEFNSELSKISTVRAEEASVYWSHTRPDGRGFHTVFEDYNKFNNIAVAEILAKVGAKDAKRTVTGWINSPKHHAVLITEKYTEIGIGFYEYEGRWYIAAHTI